ncbi:hypothetical protein GCM10027259_60260 [Micromonospora palomenae]
MLVVVGPPSEQVTQRCGGEEEGGQGVPEQERQHGLFTGPPVKGSARPCDTAEAKISSIRATSTPVTTTVVPARAVASQTSPRPSRRARWVGEGDTGTVAGTDRR